MNMRTVAPKGKTSQGRPSNGNLGEAGIVLRGRRSRRRTLDRYRPPPEDLLPHRCDPRGNNTC